MRASAVEWVETFFRTGDFGRRLAILQNVLRVDPPLVWESAVYARFSLLERVQQDGDLALDVLDYLVSTTASDSQAESLKWILTFGGSAWEVTAVGENRELSRRAVGPVADSIEAIRMPSQRAHHHLATGWSSLMGRNPNPSTAYREAIKAVEAAAKPVVTPDDDLATLGKIIRAMRDKPSKWTVALDSASTERVADMADLIWRGQLDRHGTDDPDAPLAVTQEEADVAFHVALALVRLFVGGGIRASL